MQAKSLGGAEVNFFDFNELLSKDSVTS